jgi:hypothetical protein
MSNLFRKATKEQSKLRAAFVGPSGSGKTYTALRVAHALGNKVAVIDTERGSASKYSDDFDFDVLELTSFAPERYIEGIKAAGDAGYDVLIVDSLSHAWSGKDGILEFVDNVAKRQRSGNTFGAWREATPVHNSLVDAILDAKCHVIVTMRAKTEYVQEKDERTGKTSVRKIGMQPVQRDGLEYEMDVVADLDWENNFIVSKTRCTALAGFVGKRVGEDVAAILAKWLDSGAPEKPEKPAKRAPKTKEAQPEPEAPQRAVQPSLNGEVVLANDGQLKAIVRELTKQGMTTPDDGKFDVAQAVTFFRWFTKRDIENPRELTAQEATSFLAEVASDDIGDTLASYAIETA